MAETSLKKQIMSGMVWKFAERFIAQGVSFVVSLVLARILMPSDYGIIAIINVFITIADVLLTSGLNTALIQKQDVDELDFSTIFYCNFILGMGLYAILFVAAPFLATAYKMPLLKQAIRVFAIRLPISSFQSIQTAYISRKMDFKRFFFSTIIGTLVSAVVGIVMALKGAGVWALIAQYLTNTIIDTLFLFVTVRWHPRLMFSWKRAKPLIAYGSKVMMTDLIGTIFNNLGDFIVGLRYTTADLAYYTKGKQLPMLLKTNISTALISVLFPGMSQVNDENEKVKLLSRQSVRMLSYIIFPLMAGMMVVARPLTIVLYTSKWIAMVPFVWVVCLEAVISVPGTVALQCVKAVGRSDMMLYSEFVKKPIFLISIFVALHFGIMAVALTLPVNALIELVINSYMTGKTIRYHIGEILADAFPAFTLSALMGAAVYGISLLSWHNLVLELFVQVIAGGICYIVLSWISHNPEFGMILRVIKSRKASQ